MLLLLTGDASVGKDALITEFLNRNPAWRYMAVEESATAEFVPEGGEEEATIDLDMTELYVNIACRCARELQKDNLHLVASCARIPLPLQQFLREELGREFVAAHIGHEEELPPSERPLYCTVDSSTQTLKETLTLLDRLVGRSGKEKSPPPRGG